MWLFRFFTSNRTEIYMKKQYKPSIIKDDKITNKNLFDGVPLKGYVTWAVVNL